MPDHSLTCQHDILHAENKGKMAILVLVVEKQGPGPKGFLKEIYKISPENKNKGFLYILTMSCLKESYQVTMYLTDKNTKILR